MKERELGKMGKYTKAQQKRNRAKWVKALRSGEYRRATAALRTAKGFCCLGVACDVSGLGEWDGGVYRLPNGESNSARLPDGVRDWLGLSSVWGSYVGSRREKLHGLADKNDAGTTFKKLADVIEREPEGLLA